MTQAQLEEKFLDCAAQAVSADAARKILATLNTIAGRRSFDDFWSLDRVSAPYSSPVVDFWSLALGLLLAPIGRKFAPRNSYVATQRCPRIRRKPLLELDQPRLVREHFAVAGVELV